MSTLALTMHRREQHYRSEMDRIRRILREVRNPGRLGKILHRAVANTGILNNMMQVRFDSFGASQGSRWAHLAKGTVRQRRFQGFGGGATKPLVRSGALMAAAVEGDAVYTPVIVGQRLKRRIAPKYIGKGKARKWKKKDFSAASSMGPQRIEVYAKVLNEGGGPKNLPRRPFYDPPKDAERRPTDQMRTDLMRRMYAGILQGKTADQALPYIKKKRGRKKGGL